MTRTLDLSGLEPFPVPPQERIDQAAKTLTRMAEVAALQRGIAVFDRVTLECRGWYPSDDDADRSLDEIGALVPEFWDSNIERELEYNLRRTNAEAELEIRHACERLDLSRRTMLEALKEEDQRKLEAVR